MTNSKTLLAIEIDQYFDDTQFQLHPSTMVISSDQEKYTFGRSPDNDAVIQSKTEKLPGEPNVSNTHATILVEDDDQVTLSRYGPRRVYINGVELPLGANTQRRYVIHPGDLIHLILTTNDQYEEKNVVNQPSVVLRVSPADPYGTNSNVSKFATGNAPEFEMLHDEIRLRGIELSEWTGMKERMEVDPYLKTNWTPVKTFENISQLTPTEAVIARALYQRTLYEQRPDDFNKEPDTQFTWKDIARLTNKNLMPKKDLADFTVNLDPKHPKGFPLHHEFDEPEQQEELHNYENEREANEKRVKSNVEEHIRSIRKKIDRNYLLRKAKADNFLIRRRPLGYNMPAIKKFPRNSLS